MSASLVRKTLQSHEKACVAGQAGSGIKTCDLNLPTNTRNEGAPRAPCSVLPGQCPGAGHALLLQGLTGAPRAGSVDGSVAEEREEGGGSPRVTRGPELGQGGRKITP